MIKNIGLLICLFIVFFDTQAQYQKHHQNQPATYSEGEDFTGGFKREHIFIGGNVGLGFGTYGFNAGISPEIGYSFTNWLDAGVLLNLNYNSVRADPYYNGNVRQRSFNYGTGAFVRLFPVPFLFFQAGTEYNWVNYNLKDMTTGSTLSATTEALSMLVGVGYGQRIVGRSSFHIAVMVDLLNNAQSPYRDGNGVVIPVIKTGFDFYLHPKKH